MPHTHHLTLCQRSAVLLSWAIAGALFLTVGRLAMAPDDPQAAVSILTRHGGLAMFVQTGLLAAVASGIATVIAGRFLRDVGVLATAAGLAAAALHGGTTADLLIHNAEAATDHARRLAITLAGESVGWFLVIVIAMAVSSVVGRWLPSVADHGDRSGGGHATDHDGLTPLLAMRDVPLGRWFGAAGANPIDTTNPRDGFKHTLALVVGTLIIMTVLSTGLQGRSVRHGQACFTVAASFCLASYIAWWIAPVRSAFWAIIAVPLVAVSGYAWSLWHPVDPSLPAPIPASLFLRVLPIQYVGVGTVAAMAMFWSGFRHHYLLPEPEPATKHRSMKSGRN